MSTITAAPKSTRKPSTRKPKNVPTEPVAVEPVAPVIAAPVAKVPTLDDWLTYIAGGGKGRSPFGKLSPADQAVARSITAHKANASKTPEQRRQAGLTASLTKFNQTDANGLNGLQVAAQKAQTTLNSYGPEHRSEIAKRAAATNAARKLARKAAEQSVEVTA
jgi:hypothetical protein